MNFIVSTSHGPFGEPGPSKKFTDNEKAVLQWFKWQGKYRTCVDIQPETKEDGMNLLKWAQLNMDKVIAWCAEYKCPYKADWLSEQVNKQVNNNRCSMQWEYDSLFPFCEG